MIKTAFHDDDEYAEEEIHNDDDNGDNDGVGDDGVGSADNPGDKLVMQLNISCLYLPLAKRRNLQFIAGGDAQIALQYINMHQMAEHHDIFEREVFYGKPEI